MSATRPPHPEAQTIEQVAQVAAAALDGHSEGADHIDHFRIIARALAEEGLLAAAPEPRADLADAWDEGYSACNEYQNAYVPVPRPNPYRKGN